ncbi:MAG: DUF1858 domain-containing protein [Candidatus Hodarchaeota archaeon]
MVEKIEEKITKDMLIGEVIERYPETVKVFQSHGFGGCIGCVIADFETIEEGAEAHDLGVEDLIKNLNEAIKNKKEK